MGKPSISNFRKVYYLGGDASTVIIRATFQLLHSENVDQKKAIYLLVFLVRYTQKSKTPKNSQEFKLAFVADSLLFSHQPKRTNTQESVYNNKCSMLHNQIMWFISIQTSLYTFTFLRNVYFSASFISLNCASPPPLMPSGEFH